MRTSAFSPCLALLGAAAVALHPLAADACAVCMSGADSHNGAALDGAIFLMLGFLGLVLGGIIALAITLVRRARAPLPPHAHLAVEISPDGAEPV